MSLLLAVLVVAPVAQAQNRVISGNVTGAGGAGPLPGAVVTALGHPGIVAQTNEQGEFSVSVPAGDATLVVRTIGYKRREVVVPASQSTVQVQLDHDVLELEGMVVTGQATTVARQNIATAVTVVRSADLNRVPAASLEGALQGKVPGASINLNSGAPGGGGQIQIRGVTSILGSGEPLFVLDGVIISNAAIQGGQRVITGNSGGEDDPANRLADLDPNNIESIEVLKGAAASSIYGSKATNGVVIITTKRGEVGAPRYTITQRFGTYEPAKLLGSRHFETVDKLVNAYVKPLAADASAQDTATYNSLVALYRDNYQGSYFDYQSALFGQRSLSYETNFSVSGGTDNTKYFLSASNKHQGGTMINTGAMRQDIRLNLDQNVGDRLTASVSTGFIRDGNDRGIGGNNNTSDVSPMYLFGYSPAVINLNHRDASGAYPENPFAGGGALSSNPFQTIAYVTNHSEVYRWIGSGRANFKALRTDHHSVTLSAIGGIDWFNEDDKVYSPNFLQYEPADGRLGASQEQNTISRQINTSLNAVWMYSPGGEGLLSFLSSATTSAGVQAEQRSSNRYSVLAENLIPGISNIDQGFESPSQSRVAVRDQAYYGQEELLAFDNRLFLTAGVRAERSSVNGDRNKLYLFPKASGSYRFVSPIHGVDELKIRAAIGKSGNQPRYGDRDLTLAAGGQIDGENTLRASGTLGNPNIKPETMTETEFGADVSFFNQFFSLEATHFDRRITDLLLSAPLASSSGLNTQIINGGELSSKGWELAATIVPIRGSHGLTWTSHNTYYKVRQKVESLPVPTFRAPRTGYGSAYGNAYITEGYSTTAIWGNKTLPDGSVKRVVLGDATPDFTMTFGNDLAWKRLSLNVLFGWRNGGVKSDLTQNLFDEGKNSWDYDHKAPNGDPRPLGLYRYQTWDSGHNASVYLQDASFVKLRELTLAYDLPQSVTNHLSGGIRNLRLSLTARNLFTWTSYWGMDPESSDFGNNNVARIVDLAQYPASRSFFLNINVGF